MISQPGEEIEEQREVLVNLEAKLKDNEKPVSGAATNDET